MQKQKLLILALFLILVSGCASKQNQVSTDQSSAANKIQRPMKIESENLLAGSWGDLVVGKKVLVLGTENSDGSIAANQIIIGNSDVVFNQFKNMNRRPENTTNNDNTSTNQQVQNNTRQRPDFSQFQNLSEEERAKFRAERMAGRQSNGNRSRMSRPRGEIISKDDTSITIKLENGGSQLIFFSESTTVNIVKEEVQS